MATNSKSGRSTVASFWRLQLAAAAFISVSFVALTLPDHPDAFSTGAFLRLPLEIPLMLLVLLWLPHRLAKLFAALFTLAILTLLLLKFADIGVESGFQRRFNPYLDMKMLADGWNLLSGTVGTWTAGLAAGLFMAAFVGLLVLFHLAQMQLQRMDCKQRRGSTIATVALLGIGSALWITGPFSLARADLQAVTYLGNRLALVQTSISDMRQFEHDLASGDAADSGQTFFSGIKGRDVVLIFVESYGRSAIEDPLYSFLIKPRLEHVEDQLRNAGLLSATGWFVSPTIGGLSWLAHSTFLSGLWVDSQARYDRLMISNRTSLNRLFQHAGWRTAAVMPAITMDWPEASYFGYNQVFTAKDLQYKGKPFNWITMPDQYTLSAFERLVRQPAREAGVPLMAEMALVSSHAPWTPVAKLIDWKDVGDGTVFNDQAESDETPEAVWSDRENIRSHYVQTIDYSLQTVGDYITRFGNDTIFIVLGDHQPAPTITGPNASHAVPVHIISRDAALIARFEKEGFSSGMLPAPGRGELPMDSIRARLIRVFAVSVEPKSPLSSR